MKTTIHSLFVDIHIVVGAMAMVLFWIPSLAKKGGPLHVRAGKLYVLAMYTVSISALIASLMVLADPIGLRRPGAVLSAQEAGELAQRYRIFSLFLLMLSVLVFASVRHGIAALQDQRAPGTLLHPAHKTLVAGLGILAIVVGGLGIAYGQILLMIFGGISLATSIGMIRDLRQVPLRGGDRIVAHLNGLIGSGIGAYTAFFAFGGARFFRELLPGQLQVLPWVIPSVVGTVFIVRLSRRYRSHSARKASRAGAAAEPS